ncbi:MAG: lactonase family protein, partial [Planctomycetota bacterium]|nr:lactonase family protein [Planctomycetota bacterium]
YMSILSVTVASQLDSFFLHGDPSMSFRLTLAACLFVATFASAQAQEKYRVYLGTYTGKDSRGIYQCELDLKDGSLSEAKLAGETSSPSFLAFHPNQKFLYAVNEGTAAVSAFAIDRKTGNLTFLNSQPSQGGAPCHLVIDPTGKNLLAANYSGGSCICIPLETNGKLSNRSSFQQHEGKRKHGHSIHVDQANKFALCCDLGLNQVVIYAFDAKKGTLTPHGAFNTPKGSGPRHFAWHPDGKTAYINGESNLTIIACNYDADKGVLTQKQVLSTLPEDVERKGGSTAETVVHPSGKFVYVSNRDPYNSIAIFSVDLETGMLKAVGHQGMGVKTPRNFAIEPTGRYMLVANQSGGNVIVFRIDQSTGKLSPTKSSVKVARPVCVRFMAIK